MVLFASLLGDTERMQVICAAKVVIEVVPKLRATICAADIHIKC
jgi:hypothetical protein